MLIPGRMRFGRAGYVFSDFGLRRHPVRCRLILPCEQSLFRRGAVVSWYGQRRRGGLPALAEINRARTPGQSRGSARYRLVGPAAQFGDDCHRTDKIGRRRHKGALQAVGGAGLIVSYLLAYAQERDQAKSFAGESAADPAAAAGRL